MDEEANCQADVESFVEGSIVRGKLENFVTYDSLEFRPGPHLNVIIGPNGTGKSSIVCAICLGLAGQLNWLGRATQASEFIKYNCAKGSIELELHNPDGENYIIKREIHRNKNMSCTWSVNGRPAKKKVVEELVKRLNIQIGNLTQFLPQDKVADFAKMSPQELLENTEKSVGTPEMYENHCKLKTAREDERKMEVSHNSIKERLEQEKRSNARIEVDVRNFEERQRHLEKIKVLQMKRPWVEYEERRKAYHAMKEQKEALQVQVKEAQAQNAPLMKALKEAKERSSKVDTLMKQKNDKIKEKATSAAKKSRDIEEQTDTMMEVQDELKMKRDEEAKRRKKVSDMKKAVDSLQAELASLSDDTDVQPLLERCQQELSKTNREMTTIQQQGEAIRSDVDSVKKEVKVMQQRLARLQDVSNQRLEMLRTKHKDTYEATVWLRSNMDLFQGMVFEPMVLLLNVKDPNYAKYVESRVSFDEMRMFLFEDAEECNFFLKEVRTKQGLVVNAGKLCKESLNSFRPKIPLDQLRRYGFQNYLWDVVSCPDPIMAYMCSMFSVHNIPIGDRQTQNKVADIIKNHPNLNYFFTENHSYQIKKSKYSGETSSRCQEIRPPQCLKISISNQAELETKRQLKEKTEYLQEQNSHYQELQTSNKGLERKMNQLREERKKLQGQRDRKKALMGQIQTKNQRIQQLEKEAVDLEAEETRARQKISQVNVNKCRLLAALKDLTKGCLELSMEKVQLSLRQAYAQRQSQAIDAQLREKHTALQRLERELEEAKEKCKQTRDEARRLLEVAKKATNTNAKEELSEDLREVFSTCPNTLEEIDGQIHEEQARADCTINTDENVVREYEQRKREIARLQRDWDQHEARLAQHKEDIHKIKQEWLEPLQKLITRISANFRQFFRCLKCAGEVDLGVPENPEDYEKYGIRIKVKYRDNEQLKELSPFHQSGGERSVATVCYMMALQELSKCPFRCVDEINQGMDPINERKIFELVVQTACKEGTSQYFLLTPKLLPDLDYSDRMNVLCIFNGSCIVSHTQWNLDTFLVKRGSL